MNNPMINRVPHIILLYWVIKIAATTLGETGADMFSMTFALGYGKSIVLFMSAFLIFLGFKLWIKKYAPVAYWLTFTASAVVGTVVSDYIDRTLGLGYLWGSALLISLLLIVLALWYLKEKSIDVEYITTPSIEIYYWLAFLIANTLGTALGDFLADSLEFGFLLSAGLISGLLILTAGLHFKSQVSGTLLFWIAFVLTRPFGATFGDLLTKPLEAGGLNLGTIGASLFFALVLVIAVFKETQIEKAKN